MNWLEKADLRESIINDKLYYWDIVDKTENNHESEDEKIKKYRNKQGK